ncbi:hypothetical protein YC2023_121485 [Brassica napus]
MIPMPSPETHDHFILDRMALVALKKRMGDAHALSLEASKRSPVPPFKTSISLLNTRVENPIASATLAGDLGIGAEQLLLIFRVNDDDLLKIKNTYRPILSRKRKGLWYRPDNAYTNHKTGISQRALNKPYQIHNSEKQILSLYLQGRLSRETNSATVSGPSMWPPFVDEIANPMTSLISRNQIEELIQDVDTKTSFETDETGDISSHRRNYSPTNRKLSLKANIEPKD